jgi:two-component system nitrate/nitrite response regulator NarL
VTRPQLVLASRAAESHAPDLLRVAVISDAPLVRAGLVTILGSFGDLEVSEASDSLRASADVFLTDAARRDSRVPSLVLVRDAAGATAALANGARGVLLRESAPRRMHAALHAVAEGAMVIDEDLGNAILPHARATVEMIEPLTARELEVLQLLAAGLTNKEIAQRIEVTDHTVKFHVNGIFGKLGASTRTEAVVEAARRGIIAV